MTEFDLRAIGWIVTRDTFVDIVRGAFGAVRRIEPDALVALGEQWSALDTLRQEERASSPLVRASSFDAPLPPRTCDKLAAFVEHLVADCPDRYGPTALRRRCRMSLAQASTGWLGGILVSRAGFSPDTLPTDAALVLLAMGFWCSVTTLQLWRTCQLVKMISQTPGGGGNARRSVSNRRA